MLTNISGFFNNETTLRFMRRALRLADPTEIIEIGNVMSNYWPKDGAMMSFRRGRELSRFQTSHVLVMKITSGEVFSCRKHSGLGFF